LIYPAGDFYRLPDIFIRTYTKDLLNTKIMEAHCMKKWMNFKSIKTKMILLLGLTILVVSIGMGIMSYYISKQVLLENVKKMLPEMAKESALLIENNIDKSFELLDLIEYSIKAPELTMEEKLSKLKIQEVKGKYLLLGMADS